MAPGGEGAPSSDGEDRDATVDRYMDELENTAIACAAPQRLEQDLRGGATATGARAPQAQYATFSAELRAAYEALKDWKRSQPIIMPRKHSRPGMFNSYRLRALQRFALKCGDRAGLTAADQERLYDLIDIWEGTKPGMPVDVGHNEKLRDVFKSSSAFKNALRDDVDAALLEASWRKVALEQNGDTLHAFFRPVLDVVLSMMEESRDVQYWSGGDRPASPMATRETPMNGDAFRLKEEEVVRENGPSSFVPGLHIYSDATQISKSGGE